MPVHRIELANMEDFRNAVIRIWPDSRSVNVKEVTASLVRGQLAANLRNNPTAIASLAQTLLQNLLDTRTSLASLKSDFRVLLSDLPERVDGLGPKYTNPNQPDYFWGDANGTPVTQSGLPPVYLVEFDPDKTVNPNRPNLFWNGADLVGRSVKVSVTWTGSAFKLDLEALN